MATEQQTSYRLTRFRGRPVIATPVASRCVRYAGAARFPVETLKKRIFQRFLAGATAVKLDFLISTRLDGGLVHPLFDVDEWLRDIRLELGRPDLCAVLVWPPQPARQRVYAHLLTKSGEPVAFFKISFDDYNDRRLLDEARALKQINPICSDGLKIPNVLFEGTYRGHRTLGLEPFPIRHRAVPADWATFDAAPISDYAGSPVRLTAAQMDGLEWWEQFWNGTGDVRFRGELLMLGYDNVPVCRVHGDLGTHNMVREKNRIWIFDWEDSSAAAPYLTDELCFFLRLHSWRYSRYSHTLLEALVRRYLWCATPTRRRDVMMGLAYLYTIQNPRAIQIIGDWEALQTYSVERSQPTRWMDIDPLQCFSP